MAKRAERIIKKRSFRITWSVALLTTAAVVFFLAVTLFLARQSLVQKNTTQNLELKDQDLTLEESLHQIENPDYVLDGQKIDQGKFSNSGIEGFVKYSLEKHFSVTFPKEHIAKVWLANSQPQLTICNDEETFLNRASSSTAGYCLNIFFSYNPEFSSLQEYIAYSQSLDSSLRKENTYWSTINGQEVVLEKYSQSTDSFPQRYYFFRNGRVYYIDPWIGDEAYRDQLTAIIESFSISDKGQ